jgi:hypothetical protein
MNLIKFFLYTMLLLFVVTAGGCNVTGVDSTLLSSDYAPSNLYGDTLKIIANYTYKAAAFKSNGTCSIPTSSLTLITTIGTPSYTYSKNNNTASFYFTYKERFALNKDTSYYNYTLNLKLTFTSASTGSFTGTIKEVITGNQSSLNGTKTDSDGGTFILY